MEKKRLIFLVILVILAVSACGPRATQTVEPAAADLPLTQAEVPRVSVEDAKAALDRGEAIIVDVRSAAAYETSHIAGAIHVELGEIETNPTGVDLDKDQWIITYCT